MSRARCNTLFHLTPCPPLLEERGNKYSWGIPPDPRQRDFPLDSLYHRHWEKPGDEAIPGLVTTCRSSETDYSLPILTCVVAPRQMGGPLQCVDHPSWFIRSSRMMTPDLYNWMVSLSFHLTPCPRLLKERGNKYSWGTPPDPRQRDFPLDSLYHCHCDGLEIPLDSLYHCRCEARRGDCFASLAIKMGRDSWIIR